MDLSADLAGIRLRHPVLNGSGTFDAIAARRAFGDALLDAFPFSAFVSKTITPEPRAGNAPPRIFETPAGMINSIGLPNRGLAGFLAADLPLLAELPVPLIVSVMGTSHSEFARLVEGVGDRDEVAALEQVRAVAAATSLPVIGMGGIEAGPDALAFLAAGAAAIAVGTANFRDPLAGTRIRDELESAMEAAGSGSLEGIRPPLGASTST